MVREIIKDVSALEIPSKNAVSNYDDIVKDLIDTALFHKDNCLGLAANQIGYLTRIIAVRTSEDKFTIMINPVIFKRSTQKEVSNESCLSLDGVRKALRNVEVSVLYYDRFMKMKKMICKGLLARIVQHEIDHCNGIII